MSEVDPSSSIDPESFQDFLDDVISDTDIDSDSDDGLEFLDTSVDSSSSISQIEFGDMFVDTVDFGYVSCDLQSSTPRVKGQKRRRTDDNEYPDSKKYKMSDRTSLRLPPLVSVCPRSNSCDVQRDS